MLWVICFLHAAVCASCQVILVSANKLTRYIEPSQLTDDFGGSLDYDHSDWLNKRLVSVLFKEINAFNVFKMLVAVVTRHQVWACFVFLCHLFAGFWEVHEGVDVTAGRAVDHQWHRQEQLRGEGEVRTHTHTHSHTHIYTHIYTHTYTAILKVDRWNPELCVSLSSADQLTVPSCHPLTLRLSFRPVNIIFSLLSLNTKREF